MDEDTEQLPLFGKIYDFLAWLAPLSNHFPRAHRTTTTKRLLDAAHDLLERAVDANNVRGAERLAALALVDAELDKVRLYFRLVHHWRWINPGQYKHGAAFIGDMGRLLGGWQRATKRQLAVQTASAPTGARRAGG
jgi:hypothetical protein